MAKQKTHCNRNFCLTAQQPHNQKARHISVQFRPVVCEARGFPLIRTFILKIYCLSDTLGVTIIAYNTQHRQKTH